MSIRTIPLESSAGVGSVETSLSPGGSGLQYKRGPTAEAPLSSQKGGVSF